MVPAQGFSNFVPFADESHMGNKYEKSGLARCAMVVWLASGLAFLALLQLWTAPAAQAVAESGLQASVLGDWMLAVGSWSSDRVNLLIATAVLVISSWPFAFGLSGRRASNFYTALAVVGCLAVTCAWFGLKQPMDSMMVDLVPATDAIPQ